ncbi:MAG: phage tail tape measure protein [Ruminococcus sp.]|nr:phage tail tape measure protein [Ruminococcus sp.]
MAEQNGVELAKAYVQIVPSMQGMKGALEAELGGDGGAGDIGRKTGQELGKGLSEAFSKAIEFIGDSIQTGMGFDTAMSQVAATMGKTTAEIAELRDYAKEMGASTAFSATQSAEALNFMALAGYDAQTSMKMLPNVMNLAAAGGMELARASDMVTDSQTALGLSLSETETLVDQMAKTSSKTNTSVSQLGDAMLTIGGTAKNLSGGTAELNQVLGLMADNGIKAGEAGTHLRNIILAMNPTTKDAKEAFDELNFSAYDSQGNLREMSEIFGELKEKTADMTSQERQDIIGKMFKVTDIAAVNALLDTNAERWDEVAGAIDGASGAAEAMADTQLDNLQGDITLMKSAFEGLQIAISDEVTPDLRELIQTATKGLEWATEHIHTIIGVVKALGIAVAAMKLPAMIGAAKTAMIAFNAVCAQNGLLAIFTAAAAAGGILKGVIDDATDAINEIPDAYEGLDDDDIGFVKSLAEQTDDLTEATNRRKEAEDRLHDAKNERFVLESNLRLAEEEYNAIMSQSIISEGEYARAMELQNGIIPELEANIKAQNAAVGELSTAYVRASENEKQLIEKQEAAKTAAEEETAAQQEQAKAAEELAKTQEQQIEAAKKALEDSLTLHVEISGQSAELDRATAESIGRVIDEYDALYEAQKKALDSTVDMFGGFTADTSKTFDELFGNLQSTDYYLNDWATAIEQLEQRGLGEGVVQSLKDMGTDSWDIVYALNHSTDQQLKEYTELWEKTEKDQNEVLDRMTSGAKKKAEKQLSALSGIPGAKIDDFKKAFDDLGVKSGESYAEGIASCYDDAWEAAEKLGDEALLGLSGAPEQTYTVGRNFTIGLVNGMNDDEAVGYLLDSGYDLADAMTAVMKRGLDERSPSHIAEDIGSFFTKGIAVGVREEIPEAEKAAREMAESVVRAAELDSVTGFEGAEIASAENAALDRASAASAAPFREEAPERQSAPPAPTVLQFVINGRTFAEATVGDFNDLLGTQTVFDMGGYAR